MPCCCCTYMSTACCCCVLLCTCSTKRSACCSSICSVLLLLHDSRFTINLMQLNAVFVAITGVPGSTRMCAYIQHQSSSNSSSISGVLLLLYVRVMPLAVLLCHSVYCLLYVHEYGLLLFVALVLTTGLPLYDDRSFFLWHVSWRHPVGNTPLPEAEPCTYTYNCDMLVFLCSYLFVRALFAQIVWRCTEEGRPDTPVEVWARSVPCVTRGVRSKLVSAGVDQTISRIFLLKCYFVPGILHFSKCLCFLLMRISIKTTRIVPILGFLCRDKFGVHYHLSMGALRAVCHACMCDMGWDAFFLNKKKQAAGPNSFQCNLQLRREFEPREAFPFLFFRLPFFCFFPICLIYVGVFSQIRYVLMYLFETAHLATTLAFPTKGQV